MFRFIFIGLAALLVIASAGFAFYAYEPEIERRTAESFPTFDTATVDKGRVLAAAGYCATCHTEKGGAPYAGNYPLRTGFGTIYSTNITPDPESGIGAWSEEAFRRAMHEGVDREGQHLFPAFPYNHYTKMSDEDVSAIYAFIMTEIDPITSEQKENGLPFPLNLRILQAGWKLLFVTAGQYHPNPAQSEEWNRGAYLVEGLTHCGACHTPRDALGAEKTDEQFAGATVDGWLAPPLTAENPSAVRWSAPEFSEYLKTGASSYHGIAAGPMSQVVHAGLRELPDSDLTAIGIYLAYKVGAADSAAEISKIVTASLAQGQPQKDYRLNPGERLYATACASCHYNAEQIALGRPDLGINSVTRLGKPDNLINVILDGVDNTEGLPGVVMPGFRGALSDGEIASIAGYLREHRAEKTAWPDLEKTVATIRAENSASQ